MSKRRAPRIPQGVFNAQIHNLSHEGRGIAHVEGKTTFISGALPGEQVEFRYTKSHGRYDEARLEHVTATPHINRVTPPCPHFVLCGGCSLQHLDPAEQLRLKQLWVVEQFQHLGNVQPATWMPPIESPALGYRRKARLSVKWVEKKGGLILGFHEKDFGQYITPIQSCLVLHPAIGERLTPLREFLASLSIAQQIPQIEVAVGDDATAIVIRHLQPYSETDRQALIEFGREHQFKLFSQSAGPDSVVLIDPNDSEPYLHYELPAVPLTIAFHPMDFTQVNFEVNQRMVEKAVELLEIQPEDSVLDLFCGLGNFSLAIATRAKSVVGVEGHPEMVKRATMNAALNHSESVEFFAADLTKPLTQDWAKRSYNKLLLDPARSGAEEIVANIELWSPERIVYVSCNPATLARDAGILVNQKGYTLESAGIMNMFPHTTHIETIAVFTRKRHGKNQR